MFRKLSWLFVICVCAFALGMPTTTWAQSGTGSIWGKVTDGHGAPLGGAKVTLVSEDSKVTTGASTDGTGQYRFDGLKPGTYDLTFDAKGLVPKQHKVHVKAGHRTDVDEKLKAPPEPEPKTT
jgi:hypothetical protein